MLQSYFILLRNLDLNAAPTWGPQTPALGEKGLIHSNAPGSWDPSAQLLFLQAVFDELLLRWRFVDPAGLQRWALDPKLILPPLDVKK